MAMFSGAALFGTGLGPLCSGFIAQHMSWRWVFYVQVIDCGLLILAVTIFFKETRGSVLLSRRAKLLNSWYETREKVGLLGMEMVIDSEGKKESQRIRWKVKSDEERESLAKMIRVSVYRPFRRLHALNNFGHGADIAKIYSRPVSHDSRNVLPHCSNFRGSQDRLRQQATPKTGPTSQDPSVCSNYADPDPIKSP